MITARSNGGSSGTPGEQSDCAWSHTDWSMVMQAARVDDPRAEAAIGTLVKRYWPAVYAFFRHSGRDAHEAADLTQGFVCDVMLGRRLFAGADPDRGRFRSLLLTAVGNYLRDRHRHDTAGKRSVNGAPPLSLDPRELAIIDRHPETRPQVAFAYQWSATLLREVLEAVQASCQTDGLEAHWTVFEQRVARPLLFGDPPTEYPELIRRLGLSDASQAANMMITVKRRFAKMLRDEIGRTVSDPMQVESELRTLLSDLERKA